MGHGHSSDKGYCYFLNLTCNMLDPPTPSRAHKMGVSHPNTESTTFRSPQHSQPAAYTSQRPTGKGALKRCPLQWRRSHFRFRFISRARTIRADVIGSRREIKRGAGGGGEGVCEGKGGGGRGNMCDVCYRCNQRPTIIACMKYGRHWWDRGTGGWVVVGGGWGGGERESGSGVLSTKC